MATVDPHSYADPDQGRVHKLAHAGSEGLRVEAGGAWCYGHSSVFVSR